MFILRSFARLTCCKGNLCCEGFVVPAAVSIFLEISKTKPEVRLFALKMSEELQSSCGMKRKINSTESNDTTSVKKVKDESSAEANDKTTELSSPETDKVRQNPCVNVRKKDRPRKPTPLHVVLSRKNAARCFNPDETEYYFENGFRKVRPYTFTYNTFCKGRWIGKTIREVYSTEFQFYPIDHYEEARKNGNFLCNKKPIKSLDAVLKPNDMLSSKIHRHEGDVLDTEISILVDNNKHLVVNKPSSIPIHPAGRYRNNSLVYILQKEFGFLHLHGCHRIDRLSSGIVIFAKTKYFANEVIQHIKERNVEKEYICKVQGEFPSLKEGVTCDQPVTLFNQKLGISAAWPVEGSTPKDAYTQFYRLHTDGKTSVLLCKPRTGRTHQIRVHLQYLGYPIVNDPLYNHPAWGPERFKHGPCIKNINEIVGEISRTHEQTWPVNSDSTQTHPTGANIEEKAVERNDDSNLSRNCDSKESNEKPAKVSYFCPSCKECRNPLPEPKKEWMEMYLHAYHYKGPNWEFKTSVPKWAGVETIELTAAVSLI
ncbi:unnamed protein product [Clavelina lepadiformis]|uniref:Pseudouridine synthase RsuA/RluA-like domain-containing protein n=2 Tax=Clavelina lepadiformis TaxID=159417 RepID=A0ABP0FP06_CLALP